MAKDLKKEKWSYCKYEEKYNHELSGTLTDNRWTNSYHRWYWSIRNSYRGAQIKSDINGVVETVTGNGLTGGGTGSSVTVTMGTPTTLTVSTTDTVGQQLRVPYHNIF